MKQFKLHNTDGKTFFDFRSNPESRCEGFTLSFLDDGTVVMSGDYGTLCWKRNYHHEGDKEFNRDYGFPNKDTGIGYFAEKVCQSGVEQKIEEWSCEEALKSVKEEFKDNEKLNEIIEQIEYLEDFEQYKFIEIMNEYDNEPYRTGIKYTEHFIFMFEILQSVSEQILEAVNKAEINELENIDETTNEIMDMIRQEFNLNQDTDKDDEIYGFTHNKLKELKK